MENIVCPYCNGSGCEQCSGSGQLQLSPKEIQQIQAVMSAPAQPAQNMPPYLMPNQNIKPSSTQVFIPGSRISLFEIKSKTAGLLAFFFLLLLFGGAWASHRFLGGLKPYIAAILSLISLIFTYFLSRLDFFSYHEPLDFINIAEKLHLQKKV